MVAHTMTRQRKLAVWIWGCGNNDDDNDDTRMVRLLLSWSRVGGSDDEDIYVTMRAYTHYRRSQRHTHTRTCDTHGDVGGRARGAE